MAESSNNEAEMMTCPYDSTHSVKSSQLEQHYEKYQCRRKHRMAQRGITVTWKTCTKYCDQVLHPLEVEQHEEFCFPANFLEPPSSMAIPEEVLTAPNLENPKLQAFDHEAMHTDSFESTKPESPEKRKPSTPIGPTDDPHAEGEPTSKVIRGSERRNLVTKWRKDSEDPDQKL